MNSVSVIPHVPFSTPRSIACPSPHLSKPELPTAGLQLVGPTVLSLLGWKMLRRAAACHCVSKKTEMENPWKKMELYPLVNVYITIWKDPPFFMGKSMAFPEVVPGFPSSANGDSCPYRCAVVPCCTGAVPQRMVWLCFMTHIGCVRITKLETHRGRPALGSRSSCWSVARNFAASVYWLWKSSRVRLPRIPAIRPTISSQIGNGVEWCCILCMSVYTQKRISHISLCGGSSNWSRYAMIWITNYWILLLLDTSIYIYCRYLISLGFSSG